MARLQILELPSGSGDDRPPFVLVVDECVPQRIALGAEAPFVDYWQNLADRIGAKGVIVTPETVEIPANASLPLPLFDVGEAEREGTTQLVYAHERTRLDLCAALMLSGDTTWRKLIEAVGERQRDLAGLYQQLDRVRALPEQPYVMDAQLPDGSGYRHGYRVAILDAKRAARDERTQVPGDGG